LGSNPDDCLVFEDALLGVQSAKNAGMKCVGVDRYNHPERLKEADIVIEDISKISLKEIKDF
jgi:beta-phosphoglucomutase